MPELVAAQGISPHEASAPRRWLEHGGEHTQQGCFTRPVRPEQTEDALIGREVDVVQHQVPAKPVTQAPQFDARITGCRAPRVPLVHTFYDHPASSLRWALSPLSHKVIPKHTTVITT